MSAGVRALADRSAQPPDALQGHPQVVAVTDGVRHAGRRDGSFVSASASWNQPWNKLRRTETSSATRNTSETAGEHFSATGTLRLGAGRSQVQILSPRLARAPREPGALCVSDALSW